MNSWPRVRLGEVLEHRKQFVTIDDLAIYRRPRVQLHAQGIVLRDEVPGALIKTKAQQVCRYGEFLVAEIDAKVGGFGIVPESLDGSIVSSHYFLFVVDESKLDRRFLSYFVRTRFFRDQVSAKGSTNYSAIRPAHVLAYQIPLPPLAEQRRVVARIEELAAQIEEARRLRREAVEEADGFVVGLHVALSGSRKRTLRQILRLDEESVVISAAQEYPQAGLRSFGGGLFPKPPVLGNATSYRAFNRLYSGSVVMSQVKGWEGAVAVCPPELDGWFVSPEYRTFRSVPTEACSGYLASLLQTQWFWARLSQATRGVGARRERTRPDQFLGIELPMPEVDLQRHGEELFNQVDSLKRLQAETEAELEALLPAILDRAFLGEL